MTRRLAILILAIMLIPATSWGHVPGVVLSGVGTATIDGIMSPGEWDHAERADFVVNVPGGGTTPAAVFVMNDRNSLYVAIRITRHPALTADLEVLAFVSFNCHRSFETNNGLSVGTRIAFQTFISALGPCPVPPAGAVDDTFTDGIVREDSQFLVFEFRRPLSSSRDNFLARPGDTVGFAVEIVIEDALFRPFEVTVFPALDPLGDIVVASPVRVFGNQSGGQLELFVYAQNAGTDPAADLYLGMVFPDGRAVVFFALGGAVLSAGTVPDPSRFPSVDILQPGAIRSATFQRTIPATLPSGDYRLFVALVRQGALADGTIDPNDVLAVDSSIVRITP